MQDLETYLKKNEISSEDSKLLREVVEKFNPDKGVDYGKALSNLKHSLRSPSELGVKMDKIKSQLSYIGVGSSEVDDVASEVMLRIIRNDSISKYNPFKASWDHFQYLICRSVALSFWSSKNRDNSRYTSMSQMEGAFQEGVHTPLENLLNAEDSQLLKKYLNLFRSWLLEKDPLKREVLKLPSKKAKWLPSGQTCYIINRGKENVRITLKVEFCEGDYYSSEEFKKSIQGKDREYMRYISSPTSRQNGYHSFVVPLSSLVGEEEFQVGGNLKRAYRYRSLVMLYDLLMERSASVRDIQNFTSFADQTIYEHLLKLNSLYVQWCREVFGKDLPFPWEDPSLNRQKKKLKPSLYFKNRMEVA